MNFFDSKHPGEEVTGMVAERIMEIVNSSPENKKKFADLRKKASEDFEPANIFKRTPIRTRFLPQIMDTYNVSLSELLTGKKISENGGLRITDSLLLEFHDLMLAENDDTKIKLAEWIEGFINPSLSVYRTRGEACFYLAGRNQENLSFMPEEITNYYGLPKDIGIDENDSAKGMIYFAKPRYNKGAVSAHVETTPAYCEAFAKTPEFFLGISYPIETYSTDKLADFALFKFSLCTKRNQVFILNLMRELKRKNCTLDTITNVCKTMLFPEAKPYTLWEECRNHPKNADAKISSYYEIFYNKTIEKKEDENIKEEDFCEELYVRMIKTIGEYLTEHNQTAAHFGSMHKLSRPILFSKNITKRLLSAPDLTTAISAVASGKSIDEAVLGKEIACEIHKKYLLWINSLKAMSNEQRKAFTDRIKDEYPIAQSDTETIDIKRKIDEKILHIADMRGVPVLDLRIKNEKMNKGLERRMFKELYEEGRFVTSVTATRFLRLATRNGTSLEYMCKDDYSDSKLFYTTKNTEHKYEFHYLKKTDKKLLSHILRRPLDMHDKLISLALIETSTAK